MGRFSKRNLLGLGNKGGFWYDLTVGKVVVLKIGEVSEWLKEHAWKACVRRESYREFESHPLRHVGVESCKLQIKQV